MTKNKNTECQNDIEGNDRNRYPQGLENKETKSKSY